MVTKKDAQQAIDELCDLANEMSGLANAFLLTGNTNIHFELSRHALRVRDRLDVLLTYIEEKR